MTSEKVKTHMNELIPKPHLRTSDIPAEGLKVTPKGWGLDKFYDHQTRTEVEKGVIHFLETPKYLIMNQARIEEMAKITGSEFIEDWFGIPVLLVVVPVRVGGREEDGIRIRKVQTPPAPKPTNGNSQAKPAQAPPSPGSFTADPYKPGIARTREDLAALADELGVDYATVADLVKEAGDYSKAYDHLLKEHADAILKKGTKGVENEKSE